MRETRPTLDITARVEGQRLHLTVPGGLVDGSLSYIRFVVRADADWNGLDQWLYLRGGAGAEKQEYRIALTDGVSKPLPLPVGRWEVCVIGEEILPDGKLGLRIITNSAAMTVRLSGVVTEVLPQLAPSAAEQINARAEYAKREVDRLRADMDELEQAAADIDADTQAAAAARAQAEEAARRAEEDRQAVRAERTAVEAACNGVVDDLTEHGQIADRIHADAAHIAGLQTQIGQAAETAVGAKDAVRADADRADDAADKAAAIAQSIRDAADSGAFRGPPGPAGADGRPGEMGKTGPKGEPGNNGVALSADGIYAFSIDARGHLILSYTGGKAPSFRVNDRGHLIYTI